jgi:anaerobic magnesium-protoporphyrin IX monomethyl ester cyclase
MRILLINICMRRDSKNKLLPVGLACIATSLARAGYKPDILDIDLHRFTDEEVTNYLSKNRYDIVGFGSIVSGYQIIKALARQVKEVMPETLVVVGNTVATSIPELLLTKVPQVDIAVIGEGDYTIIDIVKAKLEKKNWHDIPGIAFREGGKVIITSRRIAEADITKIPFPDYSLFEVEEYIKVSPTYLSEPHPIPVEQLRALPVNTARGCPYSCTFCTHAFKNDKYRFYPFSMIVEHIEFLQKKYGMNYANFWDELTFHTVARTEELCREIEKKGIKFYWYMQPRGNTFKKKDLALLKRCKELGATYIGGALESADAAILKAMNKKLKVEEFIEQVDTAHQAGLSCITSLVFGYPQETPETIRHTFEVCKRCEIYPSIGFLLVLPGTPMYEYARARGFIPDEEEYLLEAGDRQDLHINLTQMSDELFINTIREEAIKLKNYLNIPLPDDEVFKTRIYRVTRRT